MAKEQKQMLKQSKNLNRKTIVFVNCVIGNTIFHTSFQNSKNLIISAGTCQFTKHRRATPQAAEDCAKLLGKILREKQSKKIILIFKGIGETRKSVLKGLKKSKIKIETIIDRRTISHNGCRSKKQRRK